MTSVSTTTTAPPMTTPPSRVSPSTAPFAGPAGGPVPEGFSATSVTFVSTSEGWVLGTAPCRVAPCTSLVRTANAGGSWVGIAAPKDPLANPSQSGGVGVSEVRFADPADGWVFGPDLWSTHDGGAIWTRINLGAGTRVTALETADGTVDAVVAVACPNDAGPCPAQLMSSPSTSDHFTVNHTVLLPGGVAGPHALALHDHTGYLVASPAPSAETGPDIASTLWRTGDGSTWMAVPDPCGPDLSPNSTSPVSVTTVILLCGGQGAAGSSQKAVFRSTDSGSTWTPTAAAQFSAGDGGTVAASTASILSIATSSGASEIYYSTDGGATYSTVLQLDDGGIGWGDFGYTTPMQGVLIHASASHTEGVNYSPGPDQGTLFMTHNAGANWSRIAF
jgi:photosystem II stability/assembly factor-like uncharacterized protein